MKAVDHILLGVASPVTFNLLKVLRNSCTKMVEAAQAISDKKPQKASELRSMAVDDLNRLGEKLKTSNELLLTVISECLTKQKVNSTQSDKLKRELKRKEDPHLN